MSKHYKSPVGILLNREMMIGNDYQAIITACVDFPH